MKSMCKNACYLILILVMGWAFYEFTCDVIAKREEMIEAATLDVSKAKSNWDINDCDKNIHKPIGKVKCQEYKEAMDKDPKK